MGEARNLGRVKSKLILSTKGVQDGTYFLPAIHVGIQNRSGQTRDRSVTQGETARRLGISLKSLNHWIGQAKGGQLKSPPGADKLTLEQRRIKELER